METNNEIMNMEENGIIIPTHEFERVDFNVPASIVSYGSEVREQIGSILKTTADISGRNEEKILNEDEIRKALDLDTHLDESDKQMDRKELVVVTTFKNVLSKIGVKKAAEDKYSYNVKYQEYRNKINEVTDAIRSQKQATIKDLSLKQSIIKQLEPLVVELDEIIAVGRQDLNKFENEVNELKQKHEVEGGADLYREIQVKSMLVEAFKSKLDELEREDTLYKEQIQAYRLQQGTDIITINSQESYITAMAPTLIAQGSTSVFARIQNRRLKQMQGLNDITNEMITKNAVELQENAQRGADLFVNQGISTDSLTKLHDSLQQGFKLYTAARTQKAKKIESDRTILGRIQASLQEFQDSLAGIVVDESVYEELNQGTSTDAPRLTRK